MPKVYGRPTETEKGAPEKGPGIRKTFGIYDKPVRVSSPAMIAAVVIAAIIVFIVVMMLMQR